MAVRAEHDFLAKIIEEVHQSRERTVVNIPDYD